MFGATGHLGTVDSLLAGFKGDFVSIGKTLCLIAMIIAGVIWAFGAQSQNAGQATAGKRGVLIAVLALVLIFGVDKISDIAKGIGDSL